MIRTGVPARALQVLALASAIVACHAEARAPTPCPSPDDVGTGPALECREAKERGQLAASEAACPGTTSAERALAVDFSAVYKVDASRGRALKDGVVASFELRALARDVRSRVQGACWQLSTGFAGPSEVEPDSNGSHEVATSSVCGLAHEAILNAFAARSEPTTDDNQARTEAAAMARALPTLVDVGFARAPDLTEKARRARRRIELAQGVADPSCFGAALQSGRRAEIDVLLDIEEARAIDDMLAPIAAPLR